MRRNRKESGFTLVELAIVLVIAGLIVGGVLTGQQVIQNARISNAVNAIQGYQAQVQTYQQNYNALPGDDSGAGTRFSSLGVGSCSGGTCGDGQIGVNTSYNAGSDATGAALESRLVWAHLRAANLVKSAGSDMTAQPSNPFGGIFGIQYGSANGAFAANVLCLDSVPAAAAQAIDSRIDDGAKSAGSVQSIQGGSDTDTTYVEGQTYTLCTRL